MTTQLLTATPGPVAASGRPLRVCHVFVTLHTGGAERLFVEAAKHADPSRLDFEFVSLAGGGEPADELRAMGVRVTDLGLTTDVPSVSTMRMLYRHFADERAAGRAFDVVHTHNTLPSFVAAWPARRAGVGAVVNTQHGRGAGDNWQSRVKFLLANRATDAVVGVSEDARRLCAGQDPLAAHKTSRIWNSVDTSRFQYRGPADDLHAVSVARLSPEKDFATLLRAVSLVRDRQPQLRLTLVGDGGERPVLESLTDELDLRSCVTFLGERRDIPEQLATAGFFVSSSRTEGISLTLLEAMGVGLPIVTTDVGGNPEVVVDGETGMIVPPQEPSALADAIDAMCKRRETWAAMGRAGRDRVVTEFEIGRMVRQYEELYRRLLARRTAGGSSTKGNTPER